MSKNERQSQTNAVMNDKLQGTVFTYLRRGEIFSNQIKIGILLSQCHLKILKSVNIWHSYGQKCGMRRALSSTFSSVVARRRRRTQSARDNHLVAGNFVPNIHRF